ncbi:MAG: DUF2975 domain-containing protein [Lachnospiraceae bacterium]|nr:DUF2975 domain-containing protein [Lachnospiraceae bacterium]
MKEQAIQKINKIGKISSIIALIGKILVGIGMACVLIGAIVCFVIPEKTLTFTTKGVMEMEMDLSSMGISIPQEDIDAAQIEMLNSMNASSEGVETTEVFVTSDSIKMTGKTEEFSVSLKDLAWVWVWVLITLVMTFITLCFISSLCKAFRDCQSPFEDNVIKKMEHFGYSLIPWAVVSTITNSISDSITNNKLSLNLTVDLGVVLIVLVVLVLVYIFKYGAVLQQESDETL